MRKNIPKILYDDLFFYPVTSQNIKLGWLDWMNDKRVVEFLSAESKSYSERDLKEYLEHHDSLVFLGCYCAATNIYFGNLRIYKISSQLLSFGRLIGNPSFRGCGYGKKLTEVAIDLCFNWFGGDRILVGNNKKNIASALSKVRAGFSKASTPQMIEWGFEPKAEEEYFYLDRDKFVQAGINE